MGENSVTAASHLTHAASNDRSSHEIAILFCIEQNKIERQSLLLAASLLEFGALPVNARLYAVQPRLGPPLSDSAQSMLAQFGVLHIWAPLNVGCWSDYAFANKVYAAAFLEESLHPADDIILLDSDIIALSSVKGLLSLECTFAAKPVDVMGIGVSWGQALTSFWKDLCHLVPVAPSDFIPVKTTVSCEQIWAYFNTGVVKAKAGSGVFGAARRVLNTPSLHQLMARRHMAERLYLEQALLSVCSMLPGSRADIRILSELYNYPHHLRSKEPDYNIPANAVLLHYHGKFPHPSKSGALDLHLRVRRWLETTNFA